MDNSIVIEEIDNALTKARFALPERIITNEELRELANSSTSLKQFSLMIKMVFIFHQSNPQNISILSILKGSISKSHYPYSEWLEAIEYLSLWLTKRKSKACLRDAIQYISCIAEFNSNKMPQKLSILLDSMLETHGFDKQTKDLSTHP